MSDTNLITEFVTQPLTQFAKESIHLIKKCTFARLMESAPAFGPRQRAYAHRARSLPPAHRQQARR